MLIQSDSDLEPVLGVTLSPEHASQIVTPVAGPVVSLGQGKHVSVFVLWYSPLSHATVMFYYVIKLLGSFVIQEPIWLLNFETL